MTLPSSQCHPHSGDGETEAQMGKLRWGGEGTPPKPASMPGPMTVATLFCFSPLAGCVPQFCVILACFREIARVGLSQTAWFQIQIPPLAGSIALGKLLNFFLPQCSHLKPGTNSM